MRRPEMPETSEDLADIRLQQLLHLKGYETPDPARMARNRQNIMRRVREVRARKRWSLSDLLETQIPWFFAEPRYGVAALFVLFAALQFLQIQGRRPAEKEDTGYTTAAVQHAVAATPAPTGTAERVEYPALPDNISLFPDEGAAAGGHNVEFVGHFETE